MLAEDECNIISATLVSNWCKCPLNHTLPSINQTATLQSRPTSLTCESHDDPKHTMSGPQRTRPPLIRLPSVDRTPSHVQPTILNTSPTPKNSGTIINVRQTKKREPNTRRCATPIRHDQYERPVRATTTATTTTQTTTRTTRARQPCIGLLQGP